MSTRVHVRNKVAWASQDARKAANPRVPTDKEGRPLQLGEPIPPDSPDSPFRTGQPYFDREDVVTYRVVQKMEKGPWMTASFWAERWGVGWERIRDLVEMGWLDAAIERGSLVKRFRCRDEGRVIEWVGALPEKKKKAPKSRYVGR